MKNIKTKTAYNLVLTAMFTAIIVICTWICIPTAIPFTLQTFAVFLTAYVLDLKYSIMAIVVYMLLGVVGLPVFSHFQGGVGVLLGPTGGYIIGFVFIILVVGVGKIIFKNRLTVLSMLIGIVLCYAFGTGWYMWVANVNLVSALFVCVVPYIVFDVAKLCLAIIIGKKIEKTGLSR